jgi:proteasome accessory factor A
MEITPKITGVESELGLICYAEADITGCVVNNSKVFESMIHHLPLETLAVRAGNSTNYWLSTGARLYVDIGEHIEATTPESTSINQTVEYDAATDEIILCSLNRLVREGIIGSFRLLKNVTDEQGNYFGAHVSYLTTPEVDPTTPRVMDALATHYATNGVYAGAGRVSNRGFNVAQKLFRLNTLYSSSAHGEARPLVDTRNQALGDDTRYRRIHDSHGDATILPLSSTLKIAGTSLVLQLLEHDVDLSDLSLAKPLNAMQITASDTSLQDTVRLTNGKRMRPAEIQLEQALRARDLAKKEKLTEEDQGHVEKLIEVCDQLLSNPDKLVGQLDWVSKKYAVEKKYPDPVRENIGRRRRVALLFETLNGGTGYKLRQKIFEEEGRTGKVRSAMSNAPSDTRAAQRGKLVIAGATDRQIINRFKITEWDNVNIMSDTKDKGQNYPMADPYQTTYPLIDSTLGL